MNYLAPISIAHDRLRATLPASIPVRTGLDAAQVRDQAIGQPEVWVIFHRDTVQDTAGQQTLLDMQIAVIYLAPGLLPDLARDGEVLTAMTKSLAGYDPEVDGLDTFKRAGSLVPQSWTDEGLVAYGMLFSVLLDL